MSADLPRIRRALARPVFRFVRVTPKGFVVDDEQPVHELIGRIRRTHVVRKLFDGGFLACDSKDAITARNGTLCDECRHPRCRANLRVHLQEGTLVQVLDLAPSAAKDLLALADQLEAKRLELDDVPVRLTVEDRGHWGYVHIHRT
jgi:hypothetical protein